MDDILQLVRWAACKPDEPALLAPGRKALTYGALLPLLRHARSALRDAGIRPQEAVAVLVRPGLDSMLTCMAVSGESAFAPLDPSLTVDEYRRYLTRLGVSTLLVPDGGESPAFASAREMGLRVLRVSLSD